MKHGCPHGTSFQSGGLWGWPLFCHVEAGHTLQGLWPGLEPVQGLGIKVSYGELTAPCHSEPELLVRKRHFPGDCWDGAGGVQKRLECGGWGGCWPHMGSVCDCPFVGCFVQGREGTGRLVQASCTKVARQGTVRENLTTSHRGERPGQRNEQEAMGERAREEHRAGQQTNGKGKEARILGARPG